MLEVHPIYALEVEAYCMALHCSILNDDIMDAEKTNLDYYEVELVIHVDNAAHGAEERNKMSAKFYAQLWQTIYTLKSSK